MGREAGRGFSGPAELGFYTLSGPCSIVFFCQATPVKLLNLDGQISI